MTKLVRTPGYRPADRPASQIEAERIRRAGDEGRQKLLREAEQDELARKIADRLGGRP